MGNTCCWGHRDKDKPYHDKVVLATKYKTHETVTFLSPKSSSSKAPNSVRNPKLMKSRTKNLLEMRKNQGLEKRHSKLILPTNDDIIYLNDFTTVHKA